MPILGGFKYKRTRELGNLGMGPFPCGDSNLASVTVEDYAPAAARPGIDRG
jgi:hypothetical protein